jgi:hypothetical protein
MPIVCEGDMTRVSHLEVAEPRCLRHAASLRSTQSRFSSSLPQCRANCPLQSSKKGPRSSLLLSGLGTLITGNTATNWCPGRLSQQYEFGGVRARRVPTTLRERRCHNCRPTKMTCSPVFLGRADTTNWAQFPFKKQLYCEKLYPVRTRRKPIPKYRSRPSSNGCDLSSLA